MCSKANIGGDSASVVVVVGRWCEGRGRQRQWAEDVAKPCGAVAIMRERCSSKGA